jgi:hypothetical protein
MSGGDFSLLYRRRVLRDQQHDDRRQAPLRTKPSSIRFQDGSRSAFLVFQDIWAIVVLGIQPNLLDPQFATLLGSLVKARCSSR